MPLTGSTSTVAPIESACSVAAARASRAASSCSATLSSGKRLP